MLKKCLVVDDNAETIEIVSLLLEKAGYKVLTAHDGQEGLSLARSEGPDLVLLDIMMPVMDGLTMNRHLKEDAKTRDIPVIVMTARDGMEPMFQGSKSASIQGYLVKPFSRKDLLNRIEDLLGKHE